MMKTGLYDPAVHNRRSIRVPGKDYAWAGYYFVTMCIKERRRSFGSIANQRMNYSNAGEIAAREMDGIPAHHRDIRVDSFVVMPDHVHAIIHITTPITPPVGARFIAPSPCSIIFRPAAPRSTIGASIRDGPATFNDRGSSDRDLGAMNRAPTGSDRAIKSNHAPTLGEIIRAYKARCAIAIHRSVDPKFEWQRNYYERIIRNDAGLRAVREYIRRNPERWGKTKHRTGSP